MVLEFELGRVQYRLRRSLRGKDLKPEAELSAGGGMIAKSDRAVTQKIEEILGMDYQAFFVSVFARQKDLSALTVLTPGERKKLVMRMLQLDVLQEVLDDVRKDGRDGKLVLQSINEQLLTPDRRSRKDVLSEEIEQLEAACVRSKEDLEAGNEDARKRVSELEAAKGRRDWTVLKEEDYRKVEKRVLERRKELEEAQRAAGLIDRDLKALRERMASLPDLEAKERELDEAVEAKEAMDANLARFEQRKGAAQNLNRIRDEIGRNGEELAALKLETSKLMKAPDSLATVIANLEALEREITPQRERAGVMDAEIARLRREVDDLKAKTSEISRLGPDSLCPTCERRLGDHHHHLLTRLDEDGGQRNERVRILAAELGRLREEIDQTVKRRTILEERKRKLQGEVEKFSRLGARQEMAEKRAATLEAEQAAAEEALNAIGEVAFDQKAHRELRDLINALRPLAEKCKSLRGEGARSPELEARAVEAARTVVARESELRKAQEDLSAVGYKEGDLRIAHQAYDDAYRARESAYGEVSRRATALELSEARLADKRTARDEVAEMERTVAERAKGVERLATLEKVMADFKQNVMDRVVPTLSEVSSQFFTDMTDARYGGIELDEDYEMQVYDGQEKYPLSRFSGGEGDLANLSLRLAISRVLADRSGNDINFLILDEIFGSQDQNRKRSIMSTLNRLERQFHQIVLITHIDDTKDMMGHVVMIKELEDGTSAIVVE
ncbi:MAG: SMC family ATPase [Methanomassiliicoccus sp.]|nr:SMC family ATPase [Methanomassiliicoccus sp.]